jgi:protease-4
VDAIGQGRVWSGIAAQNLGLVDRFADLQESISAAARMAGVRPGQKVQVEVLPKPRWKLFDLPLGPLGGIEALASSLIPVLGLDGQTSDGDPSYGLPFAITVR